MPEPGQGPPPPHEPGLPIQHEANEPPQQDADPNAIPIPPNPRNQNADHRPQPDWNLLIDIMRKQLLLFIQLSNLENFQSPASSNRERFLYFLDAMMLLRSFWEVMMGVFALTLPLVVFWRYRVRQFFGRLFRGPPRGG